MNKKTKEKLKDLLFRYSLLLILSIIGVRIFHFIFEPVTVYPSFYLFKIFYETNLSGNLLTFTGSLISLEIIGACIAGSAYLLLTILNLSTPNIKIKKRLKVLGFAFILFLFLNILRIFFIGVLFIENISWAAWAHEIFWYIGSVILVVFIWFLEVEKYKIKEIPFYSDLKFIQKLIRK
jgi:exosortase/archaeosortase family protein